MSSASISRLRIQFPPPSGIFLIRSSDQWAWLGIALALAGGVYLIVLHAGGSPGAAQGSAIGALGGALSAFVAHYETSFEWSLPDASQRHRAERELTSWIIEAGYEVKEGQGTFRFPEVAWRGLRLTRALVWRSNVVRVSSSPQGLVVSAPLFGAAMLRRRAVRLAACQAAR